MADVSTPTFWEDTYAQHRDGWEMGVPHPSLVHLVDTTAPPRGRVAVPGCGRGHDARFLASRGYDVVAFDFAPAALDAARELAQRDQVDVDFEAQDIFTLGRDYAHAFDGLWEYTCFCAIDPRRRREYIDVVATVLKPGGWFLACFFPVRPRGAGPPFAVARREVRHLLAGRFRVEWAGPPPRPVARRAGQEWMVLARKTC